MGRSYNRKPLFLCYKYDLNCDNVMYCDTQELKMTTMLQSNRVGVRVGRQSSSARVSCRKPVVVVQAIRKPNVSDVKSSYAKSRASPLDSLVRYVSEAFSQIFSRDVSEVPWQGMSFTGRISHHENTSSRYREMHPLMGRKAVGSLEAVPVESSAQEQGSNYFVNSIGRVLGGNVDAKSPEPKKFYSTGYTGKSYSSRKVRKEVNRLWR